MVDEKRYQRVNQKPYIKGQAIQWPKEKGPINNETEN
jgi:hypothetical protein